MKGPAWEAGLQELLPEEVGGAIEDRVYDEVQDGRQSYGVR